MPNNNLILRTLISPWVTPTPDITKSSVLKHVDVDNNFIYLRGELIYSATTVGNLVTLKKINGNDLTLTTLNNYVTGGTYNPSTIQLDFVGNNGFTPFSVDVSQLTDTYVNSGIYNPSTGCVTFETTSGFTFDVCGFVTGFTQYWTSGSSGNYSIKVINDTTTDATGNYAVAEGRNTLASGTYSHAEGWNTIASGDGSSHAEGSDTTASGIKGSHAEGNNTIASGAASHSQNDNTIAVGDYSHAGGAYSTASGNTSFIHSTNSLVTGDRSVVLGGQNITGTTDDTVYVPYLNIRDLGGGTSVNNLGIDGNGNVVTGITYSFTGNTSGDCISDLYVSNIHSCSPLHINPLDEGNVYFGSTSGVTFDITNSRIGINTTTPSESLHVNGNIRLQGNSDKLILGTYGEIFSTLDTGTRTVNYVAPGGGATDRSLHRFRVGYAGTNLRDALCIGANADTSTSNVGINTIAPDAQLDIQADSSLSTRNVLRLRDNTDTFDMFRIDGDGSIIAGRGDDESVFLGELAGINVDTSISLSNIGIGRSALSSIEGNLNIGIGFNTLSSVTGIGNQSMGYWSLLNLEDGDYNVALGFESLKNLPTGSTNTALGYRALDGITGTSFNNIGIGSRAGNSIRSGNDNVIIGRQTSTVSSTVNNSVLLGSIAGFTGSDNEIVIGYNTVGLGSNTTIIGNTNTTLTRLEGQLQLDDVPTGTSINNLGVDASGNVIVGTSGGGTGISGSGTTNYIPKFTPDGTTLGDSVIYDDGTNVGINTTGATAQFEVNPSSSLSTHEVANIGSLQVRGNDTVFNRGAGGISTNTIFGELSFVTNTTGYENAVFGYDCLSSNTNARRNVAIGYRTLKRNTTGIFNIGIGADVLSFNTVGGGNIGIGDSSMLANSVGDNNIGIGGFSLRNNTSGSTNVAIGQVSLLNNTIGDSNTGVGYASLSLNREGGENIGLGYDAGSRYGSYSTFGQELTGTTNSIFIGSRTVANANDETNQIVIGHSGVGLGSNTTRIGNDDTTLTKLEGVVETGVQFKAPTFTGGTVSANTFTFDCNIGTTQKLDMVSATTATTLSFSNQIEGNTYSLVVIQGPGTYDLTFPSGWWLNDTAPFDFTTLADNDRVMVTATYLDSEWYFAVKQLTQV